MYINFENILAATRGGLDIILHYYPQAKDYVNKKKLFKIRDERTSSAAIKELDNGTWVVTDFGGDQSPKNAIQICMLEENVSYREALLILAERFSISGLSPTIHKPKIEKTPATENHKEKEYSYEVKEKITVEELQVFGEKITPEIAKKYNIYSLVSFTYTANRECTTIYSNENYPIFLFDYGIFKKIYQPQSIDKSYRFRYAGKKPNDYIFGIDQVRKLVNDINEDTDVENSKIKKLPEIIIASGERDALNLASYGYPVVWFNSETALISDTQYKQLKDLAEKIYILPDIDKTGVRSALRIALQYIDIHIIWLPQILKKYTDKRGNQRKDFSDYVEIFNKHEDVNKLVRTACPLRFWDVDETEKGKKINLNNKQMYAFLSANGFYRIENKNEKTGYSIIKLQNNVVTAIKPEKIKEFVIQYCQENYLPVAVENMIHRSKQLSETSLVSLPLITLDFTDNTANSQYMYFINAVWEITAERIKTYNSTNIEKYVWSNEVLPHHVKLKNPFFTITGNCETGFEIEIHPHESKFFNFLIQTSRMFWKREEELLANTPIEFQENYIQENKFQIQSSLLTQEEIKEQIHHLINKIFTIGYLLHRFKDKSRAWCVFAMDGKISEVGQSNGRSGKSIAMEALFNFMTYDVIGGRNSRVFENKHVFENINEHIDFILIDDAHEYLDFDFLFDKITGSMPINPKFNAGYKIPFELSPKIAITTNHALKKLDGSTNDRILFMVFSDYYHASGEDYKEERKPIHDFGKMLFGNDFTPEEWNEEINFFAQCIQFYLSRKSPEKINPPMTVINKRNLIASIGQNFNDWADNYFVQDGENADKIISKQEAFENYMKTVNIKGITSNRFTRNLKDWCKLKGYIYNPAPLCDVNGGRLQRQEANKTIDCIFIQTKKEITHTMPF
ncbi:MAG: hypothetical protein SNJ71_00260 [Bacteroidales bacterium]